ncbi:hypothetical protein TGDOM2_220090 [Toxoplasma gondii GAB2-2007-GAL-DOM2]|uniref:DIX domain-containing protein n=4 Tax=Toxoplasma gondii TaxID=5811 RepID=B9QPX8_TOXGV|nr:hypothetical protein TGVEG_220090 [Toxoplasma gondii VEG]KFG30537.1 hypothetical protein TGDOM2_220090 [Toxoplasma gondii GAB2-2007-GAL-DOM2]KFH00106.1 hypothetical protein TGVAND_220090 [Toxoplasma gondii VAND]PIL99939.1 hypothetical protein TGCOUG_220090 [Toxoplasma gondii COUG]CEL72753.1 TPA: hypothetical protein BN1205_087420 [Toxoplasma gondii VEG]
MDEEQRGRSTSPPPGSGGAPNSSIPPAGSSGGASGGASKGSGCTFIYYVIANDGDDLRCPNAFRIPKKTTYITLSDVRRHFPLPGTYHFRFKVKVKENPWPATDSSSAQQPFVWLDVLDDDQPLPLYDHRIYVKATRLSWHAEDVASLGKSLRGFRTSGCGSDKGASRQSLADPVDLRAPEGGIFRGSSPVSHDSLPTSASRYNSAGSASGFATGTGRAAQSPDPRSDRVADMLLFDEPLPSANRSSNNASSKKVNNSIDLIF